MYSLFLTKILSLFLLNYIVCFIAASENTIWSQNSDVSLLESQGDQQIDLTFGIIPEILQVAEEAQKSSSTELITEEDPLERVVNELMKIRDENKNLCDETQKNLDSVQNNIRSLTNEIELLEKRHQILASQREKLSNSRSDSESLFIQTLIKHKDALEIINFMRQILQTKTEETPLEDFTSISDKLRKYQQIFEKESLEQFMGLTQQPTGRKTKNKGSEINEQQDMLSYLDQLEARLQRSLKDLESNGVKTTNSLGDYLAQRDAEVLNLVQTKEKNIESINKLKKEAQGLLTSIGRCESKLLQSESILYIAQKDLNAKKIYYTAELERRENDIDLLKEIQEIFKEEIYLKQKY